MKTSQNHIALAVILLVVFCGGCGKNNDVLLPPATVSVTLDYDRTDLIDTTSGYSQTYSSTAVVKWKTDSITVQNHIPITITVPEQTQLSAHYLLHLFDPSSAPVRDTVYHQNLQCTVTSNTVWRL